MAKIALTDLPWNSPHWHPPHGGLYRDVYLHVTDPLHISLPLYSNLGTVGPYVCSADISSGSAAVHIEVPVQNGRKTSEQVQARVEVFDHDGNSVLVLTAAKKVASGGPEIVFTPRKLTHPPLSVPASTY